MTKKTRNEYVALVVILLILGYLLYHYVFAGSKSSVPNPIVSTATTTGTATASGTPGFATTSASANEFLPNGPTLDTSVLQDPVFNALIPLPQFTVSATQVGVANPFAPAAANATGTPAATTTTVVGGQETATPAATQ